MKQVVAFLIAGVVLMAMTGAPGHAFHGVIRGIATDSPDIVLIASKKKKKAPKADSQPATDPYQRAWELCRRKYGRMEVVRVQIRSDGTIICYIGW